MYIPEQSFAAQILKVPEFGIVLRFPAMDLEYSNPTDPYHALLLELSEEGLHRNVFLVDEGGYPVWRIGNYPKHLYDDVGVIRLSDKEGYVSGVTFQGLLLDIDLRDGSVTVVGRTKA